MSEASHCPRCGAEIHDQPLGLCPACLLKAGLSPPDAASSDSRPVAGELTGDGRITSIDAAPSTPSHIGLYTVIGVLGEGGMGIVYLAEQTTPIQRRVALKLIKPGMDSTEVLRRFETERQALALMDHPHIARVLDAGVGPGGRPYFVMEYVPGLTITDYCDRHRLSNPERLQLILPICAAIQHAHQKGVIHRDLKPSNILVTVADGKPVPKIIDFGIAKAIRTGAIERAAFTEQGRLIGTPEYMSPEQAEMSGLEVDTTTDIYSLGVVLYELLVGALPFEPAVLRLAGFAEIHRIIREQDPPKPSTRASTLGGPASDIAKRRRTTPIGLMREVRGDLDAIAMKAMDKDRTRRYPSASEFASDIGRYLTGEPVIARPASIAYRTKKFVRRHAMGVTAGVVVAAALVIGFAVSTAFFIRADRAQSAAVQQTYLANVAAAADLLLRSTENDIAEAKKRLAHAPVALRGWEWRLLDRQASAAALTFDLDGNSHAVAFQDDATIRALVLGTKDGKKRLRLITASLANSGQDLTVSPEESVIAVSRDGRLTVVTNAIERSFRAYNDPATGSSTLTVSNEGSSDWFVHVRDVATARMLLRLDVAGVGKWTGPGPPGKEVHVGFTPYFGGRALAVSPELGWIMAASPALPYVVDAAFSDDGTRVAAWSWGNVIGVWDIASGRRIANLQGHSSGVTAVAFMPGAGRLVSASFDGTVRVWDPAQGHEIRRLDGHPGFLALAVSPDGRRIAAGFTDGSIRVWDGTQFDLAWATRAGGSAVRALAFSPDSATLASGAGDIRIWDSATGAGLAVVHAHLGATEALAFSADGLRLVSSGDDQTLRVTNLADADARVIGREVPAVGMAFAPDNDTLVSGAYDGMVRVWRASTGRLIRTMQTPTPVNLSSRTAFALSHDGRLAASGFSEESAVYVWDTGTGERIRTLVGHTGVISVAFAADDKRLIVASGDGQVRTWDIPTGGLTGAIAFQARVLVPLRSHPRVLAADRRVRLLDLEPMQLGGIIGTMSGRCTCAAADDSDAHVVVGTESGNLSLLEVRAESPIQVLKASGPSVTSCAYSPDGRRVAATFNDGTMGVWDTSTLDQLLSLAPDFIFASPKRSQTGAGAFLFGAPVTRAASIAFSPDGSKLATAWSDGAVRIWNASPKPPAQQARQWLDAHFEKSALVDDVIRTLETESGLSPEVRAEAIRQARARPDDPVALNAAAWKVVREVEESPAAYSRALRLAQKSNAVRSTATSLNTLGVALHRTGAYRDASATLEKCIAMRGAPSAADLAFLAMSRQKLGDAAAARDAVEKLRAEMKKPDNASNEELRGFLREVETLMGGRVQ